MPVPTGIAGSTLAGIEWPGAQQDVVGSQSHTACGISVCCLVLTLVKPGENLGIAIMNHPFLMVYKPGFPVGIVII